MGKSGYDLIKEGKAKIAVPKHTGTVSSAMPVFYNPVMVSNRDIAVVLVAAAAKVYGIRKWKIADPMAATGIRGIRMLLELGSKSVESLKMSDYSAAAVGLIRKNLLLNRIRPGRRVAVAREEANRFLLQNRPFSYVDIDPFGYPGSFLDAAVKSVQHNGLLAVTATDTSALAGSAVNACRRKYLATPLKSSFMHETGVRILARLVQLFGAVNQNALLPVFSYYKEHYIRVFFLCRASSGRCDELLRMHRELLYCAGCCEKRLCADDGNINCGSCGRVMEKAGPLWSGKLFDSRLAKQMAASAVKNRCVGEGAKAFLKIVAEEAAVEAGCGDKAVGFYAIEDVCQKHRIGRQPKTADVVKRLRERGYSASGSHCTATGVKTDAPVKAVIAAAQPRL